MSTKQNKLENIKKEIRSIVITYPSGVTLEKFLIAYKQLIGIRLPTRQFGYISDIEFLYSLSDTVYIQTDKNGDYHLTCIADETTKHIQKLISKQRTTQPKIRSQKRPLTNKFYGNEIKNCQSKTKLFVSAGLRLNLFQVLNDYPDGISYHSLLVAYQKKFKRPLNLEFLSDNHHDRLDKLADTVAELEVRDINNTKRLFYYPSMQTMTDKENVEKTTVETQNCTFKKNSEEKDSGNEIDSKISDICAISQKVKNNFEKVLKLYPDGVLAKQFPSLYEKIIGEVFDLPDHGYNDFLELVDALPSTFICVKSCEYPNNWMLFHPNFHENAAHFRDINSRLEMSNKRSKKMTDTEIEEIPQDIVLPPTSYTQPQFPIDINLSVYIPIFISAITNPDCFWFKLQTEETICRFRELEDEMQNFYFSSFGDRYLMAKNDISIGSICAALYEDHWYRVTITSSPLVELVNVYFVDYGSWEKIPYPRLRYLKQSFTTLPSQAFKAELASIKPREANTWSKKAVNRFHQLCNNSYIMARIHMEFDDMVSVFLCDTSGNEDIHINDTLVDEEFAESCSSDLVNLPNNNTQVDERNEDLESSGISQYLYSNKISDEASFLQNISLGDGYNIHLIGVSEKTYISDADLCNLFWYNKSPTVLKTRLEFKNMEIPTVNIAKDDHQYLFQRCENCNVPGFDGTRLNKYSVDLYPLDCVMTVLNCLGHPSVKVRETIKRLETFNPRKEKWNEINHRVTEETCMENQNGMHKYCMYDLKALFEALQIKRMKLQKNFNESRCDNVEKEFIQVETLSQIIQEKMKNIKSICSLYSK